MLFNNYSIILSIFFILLANCFAYPGRHLNDFPSRFFIPDSSLASNLLSGQQPPQFPSIHQPILALRPPFKRYFDSLAGQSLGKRSAPPPEYFDEKRK
ncbi:Neuropeptide-like protein 3 [Meloidogyne graminicola]|uniref:Neuropeptide-like protein 3 n=1 Tax=Meloidogyne graminicola TaxID=189291 RepID=A0A8S9ZIU7_9BILA|nr:Neuropeptide-like protein 3 [Meloidogyne graminicola]